MISHLLVSYHTCPLEEPGEGLAGGMNVFLEGLLRRLAEEGINTNVITRAVGETVEISEPFEGVRIFHVPCFWKKPPTRESAWESIDVFIEKARLLLHGERIEPTVVSAHYWMSGVAAKRLFKAPMLLSYHTIEAHKARRGGEESPLSLIRYEEEARLAVEARGVVFFTEHEQNRTIQIFPELKGKSFVIPPGIDDRFRFPVPREVARSLLGLPITGDVFLFAARKDPGKNLSEALEAIRILSSRLNKKILLIVAGQDEAGEANEEHVIYLGPVPHDSMALLYSAVDAVVCPARYESFGLVPLESLSTAVPVIVPEGTFWGEMIRSEGGGLVYSADDPEGLVKAMTLLLSDPFLRARLAFSGPKVAESFKQEKCTGSWAKLISSFSTLYNPR
ncbi:MAG: glycosyltransferase [Syntrophorhabdaceae bacterium]|nr:glycosyltransferase [Syntrophorhabdaceae bacterium]